MSVTWSNVQVTLGELQPWADNPRLSSKRQAQRLLDSWRQFGQVQTVAIGPQNEVYDGHQRLSALLTVHGPSYQVDARRSDRELTDEERRALVVTLHAGAVGSWNWDAIANWDAGELQEWGFDSETLTTWQRDVGALGNLLQSEEADSADAEPQVDRAAELQEKWQVKPGDVWRIGEHRLACGDCTDKAAWEAQFSRGEMPSEIPEVEIDMHAIALVDLLVTTQLAVSKGEARRLIEQGGVRINEVKKTDVAEIVPIESGTVVQVGPRKFVKIVRK
jgi:hypothetical protein